MVDTAPGSAKSPRVRSSALSSLGQQLRRPIEQTLAMGRVLLDVKAGSDHGDFLKSLEAQGIEPRTAQKFMKAAQVFADARLQPLIQSAATQTRLFELLSLEPAQLRALAAGEPVGPLTLESLVSFSMAELRQAVRVVRSGEQSALEQTHDATPLAMKAVPDEATKLGLRQQAMLYRAIAADIEADAKPDLGHRKAYCRELARVLVRYATADEVSELAEQLEGQVRAITRSRPSQGLNDAAYAAFTRYMLA